MKLGFGVVLMILSPVLASADVAGDWAGVINFARKPLHIVLHVTGPDTGLKATVDSPDQNGYGTPVGSITLSGTNLQFTLPANEVGFSGDVNANGSIVGTFVQRGNALPLVLERVAAAPGVTPALVASAGGPPPPRLGDPRDMVVLQDPSHRIVLALVNMNKVETDPEIIPVALSKEVPALIERRAGQAVKNYRIREGSVEQTPIGGHQALRAIGEYEQGSGKIVELLTWIFTGQTRTLFLMRMTPENLPALQMPFDHLLQSARIP